MHSYSYTFVIRKDVIRKDGTSPIYLQIFINKHRKRIALGLSAQEKYWKKDLAVVKIPGQEVLSNQINARLNKYKERVAGIFTNAHLMDRLLTIDLFLEEFHQEHLHQDFIGWMKNKIEELKKVRKNSTIIQYRKLLKDMSLWKKTLAFHELNDNLLDELEVRMRAKRYAINTRASFHKNLRFFINQAIRDKKMYDKNPYKNYPIRQAKSNRVYLVPNEVRRLWALYQEKVLDTHLHRVLRWFLFMCFTGIRPGDLIDLEKKNVIDDKLIFCPNKTDNHKLFLSIPISRYAQQLIHDGEGKGQKIFRCIVANNINKPLKNIADLADIDKDITNYVGRHTFATTFLSAGGKVTVLQTLLGHSKIDTTMVYVHIIQEDKVEQMKQFDEFWNFEKPKLIRIN